MIHPIFRQLNTLIRNSRQVRLFIVGKFIIWCAEESLVDLDTVIDELNSELVKLDVEIAQTVRDQARATFNLQDDLQQLKLLGNVRT